MHAGDDKEKRQAEAPDIEAMIRAGQEESRELDAALKSKNKFKGSENE